MTERLGERVLHDIAAELLVTNDRTRDVFESRSVATVEDLELLERNRPPVLSQSSHAHAILKLPPCFIDEPRIA